MPLDLIVHISLPDGAILPFVNFPRVSGIEAVGEVNDIGGDEIWKWGNRVAVVMGDMWNAFAGIHPAPSCPDGGKS